MLALLGVASSVLHAGELSLHPTDQGCEVRIDGKLFAGFLKDYKGSPIVWPIIGPTGKKMTRDFPMIERNDNSEAKDHPHQQSMWFRHGDVNELNFWALKQPIAHRKFNKAESDGKMVELITENDWMDKDGKPICTDILTLRFGTLEGKKVRFGISISTLRSRRSRRMSSSKTRRKEPSESGFRERWM